MIKLFGEKGKFHMDMATENIPKPLVDRGIEPEDIDYVFVTHLHYDHCSNVPIFPRAKFVISRRGWVSTVAPRYPWFITPGLFPRDVFAYLVGEASDRLILTEDEHPQIIPGIGAFWTGGHTQCNQASRSTPNRARQS